MKWNIPRHRRCRRCMLSCWCVDEHTSSGRSSAMLSSCMERGGKVRPLMWGALVFKPLPEGYSTSLRVLAICSTEHDWSSSPEAPPPRRKGAELGFSVGGASRQKATPPPPEPGDDSRLDGTADGGGILTSSFPNEFSTVSRAPLGSGGGGKSGGGRFRDPMFPSSSEDPSSLMGRTGRPDVCLRPGAELPLGGLFFPTPPAGGAVLLASGGRAELGSMSEARAADWLGTPSRM